MMNSVISVCFDYDSPGTVTDQASFFIEYLLQRPPSRATNALLMSVLPKIIALDNPPAAYGKFLTSHQYAGGETTSFALQIGLPLETF